MKYGYVFEGEEPVVHSEDKMKAVKIKIIVQNIEVEWRCPKCKTLNSEWIYDYSPKEALLCCHCKEHFKGEIDVNL